MWDKLAYLCGSHSFGKDYDKPCAFPGCSMMGTKVSFICGSHSFGKDYEKPCSSL